MQSKSSRLVCVLVAAGASLALVPPAGAVVVAGWDFSQFAGDGFLSIDGSSEVNTLSANYSNFDQTFNAGQESAAFGTLFFNGQFGSSVVAPGSDVFLPAAGSLASNLEAPVQGPGDNPFDSLDLLRFEGQLFTQLLSMLALEPVSIVFSADLSSVQASGGAWSVSFGAATTGAPTTITIDFSSDGSSYAPITIVPIAPADTAYEVPLGNSASPIVYVRVGLQAPSVDARPLIDNVAISVPEAGATTSALAVLLALLAARRRSAMSCSQGCRDRVS